MLACIAVDSMHVPTSFAHHSLSWYSYTVNKLVNLQIYCTYCTTTVVPVAQMQAHIYPSENPRPQGSSGRFFACTCSILSGAGLGYLTSIVVAAGGWKDRKTKHFLFSTRKIRSSKRKKPALYCFTVFTVKTGKNMILFTAI